MLRTIALLFGHICRRRQGAPEKTDRLREDAEQTLRGLGERGDIVRTMQRAFSGQQREFAVFNPHDPMVNDRVRETNIESRTTLADCRRLQLGLTGTHLGCEHGVCGACTVLVDGRTARSCLMLAVQAEGCRITTVEGLEKDGQLTLLQQAFWDCHGLQCGFCTPGILLTLTELLRDEPDADEEAVRLALSGLFAAAPATRTSSLPRSRWLIRSGGNAIWRGY